MKLHDNNVIEVVGSIVSLLILFFCFCVIWSQCGKRKSRPGTTLRPPSAPPVPMYAVGQPQVPMAGQPQQLHIIHQAPAYQYAGPPVGAYAHPSAPPGFNGGYPGQPGYGAYVQPSAPPYMARPPAPATTPEGNMIPVIAPEPGRY